MISDSHLAFSYRLNPVECHGIESTRLFSPAYEVLSCESLDFASLSSSHAASSIHVVYGGLEFPEFVISLLPVYTICGVHPFIFVVEYRLFQA